MRSSAQHHTTLLTTERVHMTTNTSLVGNLTSDPELRFTSTGKAVLECEVAVKPYAPKDQPQPETTYHKLVCFGALAEHVADCLKKGDRVVVAGETKVETWTGRDGKERTTTKVIVDGLGPDLRFNLARIEQPQHPKPVQPVTAPATADDDEPF